MQKIDNIVRLCAPQPGLSAKDPFYEHLFRLVTTVISSEAHIIGEDINSHVGQHRQGFNCHYGGCGYGRHNQEATRILDLCTATDLAATNTIFKKENLTAKDVPPKLIASWFEE